MCRNIQKLFNVDPAATEEEIRDAALQYVRKISGYTKPSHANAEAFERAVDAVAAASARLLDELVTSRGASAPFPRVERAWLASERAPPAAPRTASGHRPSQGACARGTSGCARGSRGSGG
jgi:hypothetical protein